MTRASPSLLSRSHRPLPGSLLLVCLLLVFLALGGCAPHRVRMPGPVDHLAWDHGSTADQRRGSGAADHSEARADAIAQLSDAGDGRRDGDGGGRAVARQAGRLVGKRRLVVKGDSFRRDCSGFVAAAYRGAGSRLAGSSRDLYAQADEDGLISKRKTPRPGDVAFFHDTYDRNHNGRRDDGITHVAVVEAVADDGTILLVHYGSKGVARITMDLRHRHTFYDEDGLLRNSILRSDGKGERLTSELFVAWGSLWQAAAAPDS